MKMSDINDEYLKKIYKIQKFMRSKQTKIILKRTKKETENQIETASKVNILNEEQMEEKFSKYSIGMLKRDSWAIVFSYLCEMENLNNLYQSCVLFNEILKTPSIQMHAFNQYFKDHVVNLPENVVWKGEFQKRYKLLVVYNKFIKDMEGSKQEGNDLFRKKRQRKSAEQYVVCMDKYNELKIDDVSDIKSLKIEMGFMKVKLVIQANIAQSLLSLKEYDDALNACLKAKMLCDKIKKTAKKNDQVKDSDAREFLEEYMEGIKSLEEKVWQRMNKAQTIMGGFPMRFQSHSSIPTPGLQKGVLLTHYMPFSMDSIFSGSLVLITEFERPDVCTGVVLNKVRNGKQVGGPCETMCKVQLHNIPGIEGASQLIDGVYWCGKPEQIEPYKSNPDYKVREYWGYSAWFDGQLDGEIQNEHWTRSACTTDVVFANY